MLGDISRADEIYIICGYTDLRKSIDGLCSANSGKTVHLIRTNGALSPLETVRL